MVKVREWEQDKYIEITTAEIMMVVVVPLVRGEGALQIQMLICKYIIIVTHTCMYSAGFTAASAVEQRGECM